MSGEISSESSILPPRTTKGGLDSYISPMRVTESMSNNCDEKTVKTPKSQSFAVKVDCIRDFASLSNSQISTNTEKNVTNNPVQPDTPNNADSSFGETAHESLEKMDLKNIQLDLSNSNGVIGVAKNQFTPENLPQNITSIDHVNSADTRGFHEEKSVDSSNSDPDTDNRMQQRQSQSDNEKKTNSISVDTTAKTGSVVTKDNILDNESPNCIKPSIEDCLSKCTVSDDLNQKNNSGLTKNVLLFDLDGTLTLVRQKMTPETKQFLLDISKKHTIVIVSGSDYPKIKEQIDDPELLKRFKYIFSENGALVYQNDKLIESKSFIQFLGEDRLKQLINFSLKYIAELDIPVKRGNFIELRQGMINLCPIGRSCSLEERLSFYEYDKTHLIREKFVNALEKQFAGWSLYFTLGGQISVDCYPVGWDKSSCLRYLQGSDVYFFGDQTQKGGNDHSLSIREDIVSHTVKSPSDTLDIIRRKFNLSSQ